MKQLLSSTLLIFLLASCAKEEPSPQPEQKDPVEKTLLQFSATEAWLRLYFEQDGPDGSESQALLDNIKVFAFDTAGSILASANVLPGELITLEQEGDYEGDKFHLGVGAVSDQSGVFGLLFGFVQRGNSWQLDTQYKERETRTAAVRLVNIPQWTEETEKPVYYLYSNHEKYPSSLQEETPEATIEATAPSPLYVGWIDGTGEAESFKLQGSANFTGTNEIDVSEADGRWVPHVLTNPYRSKDGYRLHNFRVSAEARPSLTQLLELDDKYISKPEPAPATITVPMPEGAAYYSFSLELEGYFIVFSGNQILKEIPYAPLKMHDLASEPGGYLHYTVSENVDYHLVYFESEEGQDLYADFRAVLPAGAQTFHFPEIYDVFEYQKGLPHLETVHYYDSELISHDNIDGYEGFLEGYRLGKFDQIAHETAFYVNYWPGSEDEQEGGRMKQTRRKGRPLPFLK